MKRTILFAAAMSLAGCAPLADVMGNNGTAISNAADATTLDEKVGIDATNAYTAASLLGAKLATAGIIDKAAFKAADNKGYAAVQLIHTAYVAGNQRNYLAAASQVWGAVADIKALVK